MYFRAYRFSLLDKIIYTSCGGEYSDNTMQKEMVEEEEAKEELIGGEIGKEEMINPDDLKVCHT